MIHNLRIKIKDLWTKARYKLIEVLGGYACPPCPPKLPEKPYIYADRVESVSVSASTIVNKSRYDNDIGYRAYVKQNLSRILAEHILEANVMSSDSIVELNDEQYAVKVSVQLVKEGK